MENMHMLKKTVCKELDQIAERVGQKKTLAGSELEQVSKLAMLLKDLYKIEKLEEEMGFSEGGMWDARGSYANRGYSRAGGSYAEAGGGSYGTHVNAGGSSNRGSSYAEGGGSYGGDYAERRGRDSKGRYTSYSMAEGQRDMIEGIREMMDRENLSNNSREILRKAMEQLEK